MNSQKVVLQPQIITPPQIMKYTKCSQADMPPELSFPLPLSAAYQHLVLRIIDFDIFLKENFFCVHNSSAFKQQYNLKFIPCFATAHTRTPNPNSYFYCQKVNTFEWTQQNNTLRD